MRRVQALEAQVSAKPAAWGAAEGLFDESDEAVAFRLTMGEEVQKARAADRAELGLDAPPAVEQGRTA